MPSIFRRNRAGNYFAYHDPGADVIYGITTWIEGRLFSSLAWRITDTGSPSPELHDSAINAVAMVLDGVTYAAGEVATVWARGLSVGVTYTLTLRATFDDGQIDERSVSLICQDL